MATNKEMMIHGAMTDVTVLDHTAQEIDDAVEAARNSVNKAGDKMTGNLVIDTAEDTGHTMLIDSNTFAIFAKVLGQNHAQVIPNAANNTLWFNWSTDGGAYFATNQVLHTGNKPSGSYTGNGSATSRTITHGGIGTFVAVWSTNGFMVLSPIGGFGQYGITPVNLTAGAVGTTGNGSFLLATTHAALNANGVTYYYQVL